MAVAPPHCPYSYPFPTMDNQLKLQGFIMSAKSVDDFASGCTKYVFKVELREQFDYQLLEEKIERYKKVHAEMIEPFSDPDKEMISRPDKIFDNLWVTLESLYPPTFSKDLKDLEWDLLLHKPVEILGDIKVHKDGNAYLAPTFIDGLVSF